MSEEIVKSKSALSGLLFKTRPDTSDRQVIKEVLEQNAYQRKYFLIEQGENWLDLGANIGAFTCLGVKLGAHVEAYEPEPDNVAMLRTNLELNGYTAGVHQSAVVADTEMRTSLSLFMSTPYGKWGHSLYKPKRKESIEVPTVQISTILEGIDGIKMDIEGAEIPMLSAIADFRTVRKLVFEWHFDIQKSIPFFMNTIEHLRRFFPNIKHRKFKEGETVFNHFPTDAIVFCWK